jgi:hypothetical protein
LGALILSLRDDLENILRAWNSYELARQAPAVIDFDCYPQGQEQPVPDPLDRLSAYWHLLDISRTAARQGERALAERADAHLAYLRALMGERAPLDEYMLATQGCHARGWPEPYIQQVGERARSYLDAISVQWNADTRDQLVGIEQAIDPADAGDAIEQTAHDLEPTVREATGTSAPFTLRVETTNLNVYWAYWTDGTGQDVRVRLNMKQAQFTKVLARQFALHEVLGHGLKGASYAQECATDKQVPWVRLLSVHTQQQVLLEGLAQALPLFVAHDDKLLITRVRLDHYTQLVRASLHIALNHGSPIDDCVKYAKAHVPYWRNEDIADALTDRGADPLLRSYLWAYPAGIDWFVNLADANATEAPSILQAAYRSPLTPSDLSRLWPSGPVFGGSGRGDQQRLT